MRERVVPKALSGTADHVEISQITFATVSGSRQVWQGTSVASQLPALVETLAPGASSTVHLSLVVPAGVNTFTATETATVLDVIGASYDVSGSETVYVVTTSPTITSRNSASFQVGVAGSFGVTTTGAPPATTSETGALPGGEGFMNVGNGTGTVDGTPAAGSGGAHSVTFGAANGIGSAAT